MSDGFFSGIPVAVDAERIEKEISNLWKDERGATAPGVPAAAGDPEAEARRPLTHACLSNLIFYLPDRRSREKAREVIPGVGRRFPSRIFLLIEGSAGPEPLAAWVDAVCHLPARGAPPLCCEQITLEARGTCLELFPGAVVPLLMPDVPVVLVFLTSGGERLLDLLPNVVDRVVFDSRELGVAGLCRPRDLLEKRPALEVDDLAWRDLLGWRRVLSDIFDDPKALPLLLEMDRLVVEWPAAAGSGTDPGSGEAEAALLAGWLASRLGFEVPSGAGAFPPRSPEGAAGAFPPLPPEGAALAKEGRTLRVSLRSTPRAGLEPGRIGAVEVSAGKGEDRCFLRVARIAGTDVLEVRSSTRDSCVLPQRVRYHGDPESDILGSALERSTHQGVLRGALRAACGLR